MSEDQKNIVDEIVWNEMFGESSKESFKGLHEVEVGLNSIMEESNINKEQRNETDMSKRTWNKEVNKLVMKCYLLSEQSKREYRRRICDIWQDIGTFEITKL